MHRLITSIFFPQEEISKAGKKELELLWCMIHQPQHTPHFGSWLLYKLLKIGRSNRGSLCCGGIITIILRHPALGIQFPGEGLEVIRGERLLTIGVLSSMHMLRRDGTDVYWMVSGRDYLRIDNRNRRVLQLLTPASRTNWSPRSNLGVSLPPSDAPPSNPPTQARRRTATSSAAEPSTAGPSTSIPPPDPAAFTYHDMYMAEFARLNASVQTIHQDYNNLYDSVCEIDNNYTELAANYESLNDNFQSYRATQEQHNETMFSLIADLHSTCVLGNRPSYPPQPPPTYQQQHPFQQPDQHQQQRPSAPYYSYPSTFPALYPPPPPQ